MRILSLVAIILVFASAVVAQKTNDTIQAQIRSLKADKQITLSHDAGTSKVMAISENFSDADAKAAGVQAMNFGMAFFYPGTTLAVSPEEIDLTFWVMSKKPQFGGGSKWIVTLPSGDLDLGDSRYVAKQRENMEYLNFTLKRDDLAKIAAASNVTFKLGTKDLTFTPGQLQTLRHIIAISEAK